MDVDAALQSQIRNIETTYGKPLDYWFAVIDASGLTKHNAVVAMLKADHGLAHGAAHGAAHRVSLLAWQRDHAQVPSISDRASAGPTTRSCRSPPTSRRPDCSIPPAFAGSKPAAAISRPTSSPARSSSVT